MANIILLERNCQESPFAVYNIFYTYGIYTDINELYTEFYFYRLTNPTDGVNWYTRWITRSSCAIRSRQWLSCFIHRGNIMKLFASKIMIMMNLIKRPALAFTRIELQRFSSCRYSLLLPTLVYPSSYNVQCVYYNIMYITNNNI